MPGSTPPPRLLGYIRVSSVGDRDEESERFQTVKQQAVAISRAVAGVNGVLLNDPVAEADLNVSGGTMKRTRVEELVRMVDAGEADGIVVAWLDRWARTVDALELFKRWAEEDKIFISAAEQFNASTAMGRFTLGMMLMVAQFYREQTQERFELAKKSAITRGIHVGPTPIGYVRDPNNGRLLPDPESAHHITEVFRLAAEGEHAAAVRYAQANLAVLMAKRQTRRRRKQVVPDVTSPGLRRILGRRVYLGEIAHETAGKFVGDELPHDPLVDERTWQLAQSTPNHRAVPGEFPLTGFCRCPCGQRMSGQTLRRKSKATGADYAPLRRYNCHNHDHRKGPHVSVGADVLEDAVRATMKLAVGSATFRLGQAADVAPLELAMHEAETELESFATDLDARRDFGEQAWRAGIRARREAVDETTRAYRDGLQQQRAVKLVPAAEELDDDRQLRRAAIAMIDAIDVKPAPGTLRERVKIRWAFENDGAPTIGDADPGA